MGKPMLIEPAKTTYLVAVSDGLAMVVERVPRKLTRPCPCCGEETLGPWGHAPGRLFETAWSGKAVCDTCWEELRACPPAEELREELT